MNKVNLQAYQKFVEGVTSEASNSTRAFIQRLEELALTQDINPALLNTAGMGLASEAGEFGDIVKKVLFHSKEVTPELRDKMSKELGDVFWYWINACRALGLVPDDVIQENVTKLEARHPNGKFNINYHS